MLSLGGKSACEWSDSWREGKSWSSVGSHFPESSFFIKMPEVVTQVTFLVFRQTTGQQTLKLSHFSPIGRFRPDKIANF
jgi:hypothetical protein